MERPACNTGQPIPAERFPIHEAESPAETQRRRGWRCLRLMSPRLSGSAGHSPPIPSHVCRPRAPTRRQRCRIPERRVRAPGLQSGPAVPTDRYQAHEAESPAETQRRRGWRCLRLMSPRLCGSAGHSPPIPSHVCRPRAPTRRQRCCISVRRVRAPGLQAGPAVPTDRHQAHEAESPAETQRLEVGGVFGSCLRVSAALRAILLQSLRMFVGRVPPRGGKEAASTSAG